MSFNIWFVPTNSSHMAKNLDLLRKMREAGHSVLIICVDDFVDPLYHAFAQIKDSDFEYETIPTGAFRLSCPPVVRWSRIARSLYHARQERKLPRILRAFLSNHRHRPDVLIFCSEVWYIDRRFIETAKTLGIPSILIADGIYVLWNDEYRPGFLRGMYERLQRRISHRLHRIGEKGTSGIELALVINETSKAFLEKNGLAERRIRVMGAPEYVALAKRMQAMKDEDYSAIRRRIGILSDRPVVLFAHQPLAGEQELQRMILDMVEGCRVADAVLLVKFHPRSDDYPDAWRKWAEGQCLDGNRVVFVRDECTSQDAVIICTALVTLNSTVALEALTCRRPMLLIKFLNTNHVMTYADDYGIALDVRRREDLAPSVAAIVLDEGLRKRLLENYPRAIKRELNDLDENVVGAMLKTIEHLLENRARSENASNT